MASRLIIDIGASKINRRKSGKQEILDFSSKISKIPNFEKGVGVSQNLLPNLNKPFRVVLSEPTEHLQRSKLIWQADEKYRASIPDATRRKPEKQEIFGFPRSKK